MLKSLFLLIFILYLVPLQYKTLLASSGSYTDLLCHHTLAPANIHLEWFSNKTDVTSLSSGTVISQGMAISKLRVNYTTADDVYSKYSCVRQQEENRLVVCTSPKYTCKTSYSNFTAKSIWKIRVILSKL
jgi:hypothetical protein